MEDISPLVDYLLAKINLDLNKQILGVSDDVMEAFLKYTWPGNVRELENLLVSAVVVAKGQILSRDDFNEFFESIQRNESVEEKKKNIVEDGRLLTLDEVEEQYIRKVIKSSGNKTKGELCDILGISRPTFERKLEKYGITIERE
jgi:two-component system response regulator AtoC